MKKLVLLMVTGLALAGAAFGQSYTVQSLTGRVEAEVGGQWKALKAGDTLEADAVIRTGVNAAVTLKSGEQTFNIGAVQKGAVSALAVSAAGIRIEGKVSQTDTGAASRTSGRVSTASARASNAAAEEDIAAE